MARVTLLTQDDLPEDYQYLLDEDAMGEINLLCAMANNPDALQAYMRYGSALWSDSGLDSADVERCILAVARELDAAYEWNQHVGPASEYGVPDEEIAAIAEDRLEALDDRTTALTRYVQAVVAGEVDDATFEAVAAVLDDATVVGATLLATHYIATQRFLDALALPIDGEFGGWGPE